MYSGWPPLSKERRTSFLLFSPLQSGLKGGTAFPCSASLIIAFWEQAHINFCHPKHHLVLLCHSLVLIHQQTPTVPPGLREDRACVAAFQSKRPLSLGLWHQLSHFTKRRKQGPPVGCNMSQHLATGPTPSSHYFKNQLQGLGKIYNEGSTFLTFRNITNNSLIHAAPVVQLNILLLNTRTTSIRNHR